jgi:hypothetical protein
MFCLAVCLRDLAGFLFARICVSVFITSAFLARSFMRGCLWNFANSFRAVFTVNGAGWPLLSVFWLSSLTTYPTTSLVIPLSNFSILHAWLSGHFSCYYCYGVRLCLYRTAVANWNIIYPLDQRFRTFSAPRTPFMVLYNFANPIQK